MRVVTGRPQILVLIAAAALAGCATRAEYPLAVPAGASDDFYERLSAVAESERLGVQREHGGLEVATPDGDVLHYRARPNGVVLVVAPRSGLDPKAERLRRERLKALSDRLVSKSRPTTGRAASGAKSESGSAQ